MTRRRRSDADQFLDDTYHLLLTTPAWVGPFLAFAGYFALAIIIPSMFPPGDKNPAGLVLTPIARAVAPFVGIAIMVVWIAAEVGKRGRRNLLNWQSGVSSIRDLSWQEFERLVGEAYRRQGYAVEERGGHGSDGGIDLVLRKDGESVLVQCKQWKAWKVGVKPVRELYGVMISENATREAVRFAEGMPVELLAGEAVWNLVRSLRSESSGKKAAVDTPRCPKCGSPMVRRTARSGKHFGKEFWGRTRYPNCRGIVNNAS